MVSESPSTEGGAAGGAPTDGEESARALTGEARLLDRLPEFWREHAGALEPWLSALEGGVDELAGTIEATRSAWTRGAAREALARHFPGGFTRPARSAVLPPRGRGTLASLRRWLADRGQGEVFPAGRRIYPWLEVQEARRGLLVVSRARRAAAVVVWDRARDGARGVGRAGVGIPTELVPLMTRVQVMLPSSEEDGSRLRHGSRVEGQLLWDSETARATLDRPARGGGAR